MHKDLAHLAVDAGAAEVVIAALGADVVERHPIRASPDVFGDHFLDVGLPELCCFDDLDVALELGQFRHGGLGGLEVAPLAADAQLANDHGQLRHLEVFADVLMNPAFREEMIRKEKDEILENIRRENDTPRKIIFREFRKIMYKADHPYSRKIIGYKDTVESITREDMVAFHKKYFCPNNVIMGISGDFDTKEILEKLKAVFADWKKREIDFPEVPAVEKKFQRSINYIYKDVNQASVVFGHIGINRLNKDYFPIKIMNFILGGGSFTSRIPSKVRSDEGLAYSAYSGFHTPRDGVGHFRSVLIGYSCSAQKGLCGARPVS